MQTIVQFISKFLCSFWQPNTRYFKIKMRQPKTTESYIHYLSR